MNLTLTAPKTSGTGQPAEVGIGVWFLAVVLMVAVFLIAYFVAR